MRNGGHIYSSQEGEQIMTQEQEQAFREELKAIVDMLHELAEKYGSLYIAMNFSSATYETNSGFKSIGSYEKI